jgi:hypothetical protein
MSVYTNPASGSVEQARAYTKAVIDLLGERNPFEILRATTGEMRARIEGLSPMQLGHPELPGKWSILQVIQHLADSELVWSYRIRMVLAQDRPRLAGYDQDLWADKLRYSESTAGQSLTVFDVLRSANIEILDRISEDEFGRVGIHEERGEESLGFMIRLYAGHDILHMKQIDRIKKTIH